MLAKTSTLFHSVAVKRRCEPSGEWIQDGLSRRLSWNGVQHHEAVLEPWSCLSTQFSYAEGLATTYPERHWKKTLRDMTDQTQKSDFLLHLLTLWTPSLRVLYLWVSSLTSCCSAATLNVSLTSTLGYQEWMINCHVVFLLRTQCLDLFYIQILYILCALFWYPWSHWWHHFMSSVTWLSWLNPLYHLKREEASNIRTRFGLSAVLFLSS